MSNLQRCGGIAALIEAGTFIVGFAIFLTLLGDADYGSLDVPARENVEFLADNEVVMYVWHFVIYVVFGVVLIPLVLALSDRLQGGAPVLVRSAAVLGFIWAGLVIASGMVQNIGAGVVVDLYETDPAQAASTWLSLHFVVEGLGGGNEIVGGLWLSLVTLVALRLDALPRLLNYVGVIVGLAGILTVVPPASEGFAAIFGLGLIIWFVWAGIVMLRDDTPIQVQV